MPVSSVNSFSSGAKLCWYGCGVWRMRMVVPLALVQLNAPVTSSAALPPPLPVEPPLSTTQPANSGAAATAAPEAPSIRNRFRRLMAAVGWGDAMESSVSGRRERDVEGQQPGRAGRADGDPRQRAVVQPGEDVAVPGHRHAQQ